MANAWSVWTHPARSARELQQQLDQLCEYAESTGRLEKRVAELSDAQSALREQLGDMTERRDKLDATVMELTRNLIATRQELDQSKARLAEFTDMSRAMDRFEEELGRAEEMKNNYEERIARLRAKIVELKSRLDAAPAANAPAPDRSRPGIIDMGGSFIMPPDRVDPDADWLTPLP